MTLRCGTCKLTTTRKKQREAALRTVFGVDSQLIADGTYLVADASSIASNAGDAAGNNPGKPAIAGCGGWSKRKTLFGGDQWSAREDSLLDPACDAAKIRAFFIHPAWARQGVGTLILDACETAARAAGFTRFEMGATLTGVKLFSVKGYAPIKRMDVPLDNGEVLPDRTNGKARSARHKNLNTKEKGTRYHRVPLSQKTTKTTLPASTNSYS